MKAPAFAASIAVALIFGVVRAAEIPPPSLASGAGSACPPLVAGYGDRPGADAIKAFDGQSGLESFLDTFHMRDRVLEVGVDLSKSPAALDLVADNAADVPFVAGRVPKKFEDVPIEVTETKPYDRFLPYLLRTRGLSRAPNPPAGCPQPNERHRPDLDVVRAMAARMDLEADLKQWSLPGSDVVVDGIGIDLQGKVSALDVTVDKASDVAPVRAEVPKTFEGVPTEVDVIETSDGGGAFGAFMSAGPDKQSK